MKGSRTPSQDDGNDREQERPTRRERSARHKKRGRPGDFDRPKRTASKPRPWEEPDWEEDDYLDDDDEDDDDEDDEDTYGDDLDDWEEDDYPEDDDDDLRG